MSRAPLFVFLACASLGALAGCKDKATPVEPPALPSAAPVVPAVPAPATAAAPVAAAPAAPAVPDLPTSEDYEQQAIDQINPQSMAAELDQLEKDIGK
ncbi:MAG TPA: hypothetical protein VF395_08585 [Polyangiaceae bacterium]